MVSSVTDPSTQGAPVRPDFSRPVKAKFGIEAELPHTHVSLLRPGQIGLGRGTVLLERDGWRLECDRQGNEIHLEFVTEPLSSEAEIRAATREITDLCGKIRERAARGDRTVRLGDLVSDPKIDCKVTIRDLNLPCTLQTTYGIGLDHLEAAMEEVLEKGVAKKINKATDVVAKYYAKKKGEALPEGARSFARLLSMYRQFGTMTGNGGGASTVHAYFRMMARSDFCSIYNKLLSERDQEAVRWLLTTPEGRDVPPMMDAFELPSDAQLFGKTYKVPKDGKLVKNESGGTTVKEWFQSILEGRSEKDSVFRKDLLSPPRGYPLHTGNLDKDYGMGTMGVDEEKGLILFEIRGTRARPGYLPMNTQFSRAALKEFRSAYTHNGGRLQVSPATANRTQENKFNLLNDAYSILKKLKEVADKKDGLLGWGSMVGEPLKESSEKLGELIAALDRRMKASRTKSEWEGSLKEAMVLLRKQMNEVVKSGPTLGNRGTSVFELYRKNLVEFEDRLWAASESKKEEP